jgi:hypothetical protein
MARNEMVWEGSPMAALVSQLVSELGPARLDDATLGRRFERVKAELLRRQERRRHVAVAVQWGLVVALVATALFLIL